MNNMFLLKQPITTNANIQNVEPKTCSGVSGRSKVTFETAKTREGLALIRVIRSSRGGICGCKWHVVQKLLDTLHESGSKFCTGALFETFKGQSNNTPGFLLAALCHEGYVEPLPGQKPWRPHRPRWYRLAS